MQQRGASLRALAWAAGTCAIGWLPFIVAAPAASDCTGTIASLDDVAAAVKCTTVNINSFTVPAGETFDLKLLDGTTVNLSASSS